MFAFIKNNKYYPALFWLCFCVSTLIFSSGISWKLNSAFNFTYPVWYHVLDIDSHITTYAPQNKYHKNDFVNTDKEQHYLLFAEVVDAINNHGEGLANITYQTDVRVEKLFTQSEVIHLQDVSILIDNLTWLWLINFLPLSLLSFSYLRKKVVMPIKKLKLKALIITASITTISFLLFGFKKLFYYFHTVVFPDNHQWFFYYQESLMSTFMKAPDLFAVMGLNLVVVALFIFYVFNTFLIKKISGFTPNQSF